MHKILISGYYGFNNIGDESILRAVIENLRSRLKDIEITVLSQNPAITAEKHGVLSADRKSLGAVFKAIKRCDLLISGGGSLLQDATSKRSILYYLFIIRLAQIMGKKVFIYSQGIGPISTRINRYLTSRALKRAAGIVVRDEKSKELLQEIGVSGHRIAVTADPVLRIAPAALAPGREILESIGLARSEGKTVVGWAIKERNVNSAFVSELAKAIESLTEKGVQSVLIPFDFAEDIKVIEELKLRLGDKVCCLTRRCLTDEMLSIIGNMDVLVGVRLHSLIYAAVMNVPMIAISYDPKINSFMSTIDMKAMCSVYDFKAQYFLEEYDKTMENRKAIQENIELQLKKLIAKLDVNEAMISRIMDN